MPSTCTPPEIELTDTLSAPPLKVMSPSTDCARTVAVIPVTTMSVSFPWSESAIQAGALIVRSISVGPERMSWETRISPAERWMRMPASSSVEVQWSWTSSRFHAVTVTRPEKLLTSSRVPLVDRDRGVGGRGGGQRAEQGGREEQHDGSFQLCASASWVACRSSSSFCCIVFARCALR